MIELLRAEQIKLTSIRSPYWCLGLVVILSLGVTGLFAALAGSVNETAAPDTATSASGGVDGSALTVALLGLNQFAVIVLMIMSVIGITSEYRFSTIRTTFLAVPKRISALLAKAAVYVTLTFVTMLILTLICVGMLVVGIGGFGFGDATVIRQIWGIPVYAALCVLLSMGVGALVRQTAGAISIVLVWMLVVETILGAVPKVKDWFGPFLPFANGSRFLSGATVGDDYHWNSGVSLVYFAVWAVVVFVAGVWLANQRDA
ncbi:ABC transporter permease [Gordonia oryzae]|uniref:ABC transporter permease n=1 Tax=Gordonia oryzae TaxID=2487349 RepID=A0A3N4GE95_9ACTN|nr:ABC transporter permease [Gordonia oryzae]RPA58926.1 ABC transporter permease [Gordonia oryzae]